MTNNGLVSDSQEKAVEIKNKNNNLGFDRNLLQP